MAGNDIAGIVFVKNTIAVNSFIPSGRIDLSYQTTKESLKKALEIDDIRTIGMAYCSHGGSCYYKGMFDESESHLLKAVGFCERSNHFTHCKWKRVA